MHWRRCDVVLSQVQQIRGPKDFLLGRHSTSGLGQLDTLAACLVKAFPARVDSDVHLSRSCREFSRSDKKSIFLRCRAKRDIVQTRETFASRGR